jgi:2-oxoglutarate ferredoxin oxidoreductase subunit gamma
LELEAIFAGFGGQGVMLIGQLVAYGGMNAGLNVSWFPSYGPEMRGGTANCSVVVSDGIVGSPVVSEPHVLVAMNRPSLEKFQNMVKPGGFIIYNTSLIDIKPDRTDVNIIAVPANEIAVELGEPRVANMVVLGALLAATKVVTVENIMTSLKKVLPAHRHHLLPLNEQAVNKGMELVS